MRTFAFGEWISTGEGLAASEARTLRDHAAAEALRQAPPEDRVLEVLERVRRKWEPGTARYRLALERLPALTAFSPKMVELGLGELGNMLSRDVLKRKLDAELGSAAPGRGGEYRHATRTLLQYRPLGVVLHVLSGNVFLVGPGALLEGLLTGNVNILKMPSAETFFMPLFLESLLEADPKGEVARRLAVVQFGSGARDVREIFQAASDGIVIWGGEEAVRAYRDGLPARTRVVVYGPKLSFAVVTAAGAGRAGVQAAAQALASELAIWDQNACTAPQVCYVEGEALARELAEALPAALERGERELPSGPASADTAVEIRKLRGVAEIGEARGEGALRDSGEDNVRWTVLLEKSLSLEASPLHRTIRVIPYVQLDEVVATVSPYRGYLQTVGLCATEAEHLDWAARLAGVGAQRLFRLGDMAGGEIDDPHDGAHGLPQLLSLTVTRLPALPADQHPWDLLSPEARRQWREARLRELVWEARKAPFYRDRLGDQPLETFDDLVRAPLLEREDWERGMAPGSPALRTRPFEGGYVTRSGGSTGVPKFSYFDKADWDAMLESATRVFRACGLVAGDRVANFMGAWDLYGGFVSFNHVNHALGAQSYCFGGAMAPQGFLDVWERFGINAIQGVPGSVLVMLRKCRELRPGFRIEKLLYAGQPLAEADRRWLRDELGAKRVASIIGTTEANQLAYQCERQEGTRLHHVAEDYNHVELVAPEGAHGSGEAGRIAITGLRKHNYPVIRYLNGDAAAWAPACGCGRGDRVLDYRGRCDDIVCVAKINLQWSDVRQALAELPVTEAQARFSFAPSGAERMELLLEVTEPGLEARVRERLFERLSEFEDRVRSGQLELVVSTLAPGTLPRNERTGKVKALVDARQ